MCVFVCMLYHDRSRRRCSHDYHFYYHFHHHYRHYHHFSHHTKNLYHDHRHHYYSHHHYYHHYHHYHPHHHFRAILELFFGCISQGSLHKLLHINNFMNRFLNPASPRKLTKVFCCVVIEEFWKLMLARKNKQVGLAAPVPCITTIYMYHV